MAIQESRRVMDAETLDRTVRGLAREIVGSAAAVDDLILVGIRRRGVPLAERLARHIAALAGAAPPVGSLDIALYRDDLTEKSDRPLVQRSEVPVPVDGRRVVLVDDVLYTGRTTRAALDAVVDLGRPSVLQLAVLIDRGHRELPIRADYVGLEVATSKSEVVEVRLAEIDGSDEAWIMEQVEA